jgi:hypothetical protein
MQRYANVVQPFSALVVPHNTDAPVVRRILFRLCNQSESAKGSTAVKSSFLVVTGIPEFSSAFAST